MAAVPSDVDEFKGELNLKLTCNPTNFRADNNAVWLAETKLFLEQVEDVVDEDVDTTPPILSRGKYAPSVHLGDEHLENAYLYDLDSMVFTLNEKVHFPLDNLPPFDEWISYIAEDGSAQTCVGPWTPDVYRTVADARVNPVKPLSLEDRADLELYQGVDAAVIQPSAWSGAAPRGLSEAYSLAKIIFTGFISGRYSRITNVSGMFDGFLFEELAKDLLAAASPANSTFTVKFKTVEDWIHQMKARRNPSLRRFLYKDEPEREKRNSFWFRDRLIVLAQSLVEEDHFKSKVGFVIRRAKEKGLQECTALLWSIHHVAVVVVSGEKISHSEVIPVAAAFGRDELKDKFETGLKLIMHYLAPPASEGNGFFGARLPLDVFFRVMEFTDEETSVMLGWTSKALRHEWLKHPWIGPYVVAGPSPDGNGFLAREGRTRRPCKISLSPFNCLAYTDEAAIHDRRRGQGILVISEA